MKLRKFEKKIALVMASLVLAMALLTSCGKKEEETKEPEEQEEVVDFTALRTAMEGADDTLPAMSLADSTMENSEKLYSFLSDMLYSKVDSYFFSYATLGTAEEIAVIKVKDKEDVKLCVESLERHVAKRVASYKTYDPTQVPRMENAIVFSNDEYAVLIVSDKQNDVKNAFYAYFAE